MIFYLPCVVNDFLGDPSPGHFVFYVGESGFVFAEVVGHVPVSVHPQKVGAGVDQELHQVQVTTRGGGVLE